MSRNYTDRIFGNLGHSQRDAANCPICGAPWDFSTTWLGQVVEVHPVTRCVPRVETAFEKDEDSSREARCEECLARFTPTKHAAGSQIVCGEKCRRERRDRLFKEGEIRRAKAAKQKAKRAA
jgi:hypothetical protein